MQILIGAKSDAGRVRKKNEDRCGHDQKAGIYVVCDGMGGQAAGEVAAEMAVRTILDYYAKLNGGGDLQNNLLTAIQLANSAIFQAGQSDPKYHRMGSTVVAISIKGNTAAVANVGDARGYLLREGVLRQVTKDHSLVAEQVRRGTLKPEEAESAPWRNIVTRALGGAETAEPDLEVIELCPQDTLIAASDGVIKFVADDKLREILTAGGDLQAACDRVVETALNNGSDDNATCMLLRCEEARTGASAQAHAAAAAVILGG